MSRGTLLRTPLLTLGSLTPAGLRVEWTLDLEPLGERPVVDGQRLELHVVAAAAAGAVPEPAVAAFDVLPADHAGRVTGGPLVRLLGTGAAAAAGTPTLPRTTVERPLGQGERVAAARSAFVAEHPDDLTAQLLVLREPAATHLFTWWEVAADGAPALQFAVDAAGLPPARSEAAARRSAGLPDAGTIVLELRHEDGPPLAGAELEAAFAGGVRARATTGEDGRATLALPPGADPVFRLFLLSLPEAAAEPGAPPAPAPGGGVAPPAAPVDTRPEVVAAFAFDSAFPAPIVHANLLRVRRKASESPAAKLIVFGHTDKVGGADYNLALSDRRAQAVLALLIDDREMFESVAVAEGWDTRVHQSMLRGIGCNPGAIDGDPGAMTRAATLSFQREYNLGVYHERSIVRRERPTLTEDGALTPATRTAIRDAYVAVAPHVQRARFAEPPFDGCGKSHHVSERDDDNRRAVVAFLPGDVDLTQSDPCERYGALVGETPEDRRGPHFADHQWLEEEGGALHLSSATAVPDGSAARIRVVRCEGPVPMPPPDSSGGGAAPALGPEVARVTAQVQGGICHGRWARPEPWVLDPGAWMVDLDVGLYILEVADHAEPAPGSPDSGAGLLAATGLRPPVFVAEAGDRWGVSGPPGQRLNRISLAPGTAADEQPGIAVATNGALVPFAPTGGRVDAGEAIDVTSLALAGHELADAGTAAPADAGTDDVTTGSGGPPGQRPRPAPADAATIHVQDEGGAPLPGVTLRLIEPGGPHEGTAVVTDAGGDVTVTLAAPGDHRVTAVDVELLQLDEAADELAPALMDGSLPDPFAHQPVFRNATTLLVARPAHVVLCPGCGRPWRVVRPPVGGTAPVICPDDLWDLAAIPSAVEADATSFLSSTAQDPAAAPNAVQLRGSAALSTAHGTTTAWREESRFAIANGDDYRLWGRLPSGATKDVRVTGRLSWAASPPVIGPGRVYEWQATAAGASPPYTFAVPSPESGPLADSLFWITVHHTTDSPPLVMRHLQGKHQTSGSESGGPAADVGYHFVIDWAGSIWEGRPLAIKGSHVDKFNGGNVGIALQGDFESRVANLGNPDTPTPSQLTALENLVDVLAARFTIRDVDGHHARRLASTGSSTECPGDELEGFVASPLRARYPGPP